MKTIELTPEFLVSLKAKAAMATPGPWENIVCCSDDGVVYEIANPVLRQKTEENGIEDEVIWNIIKSNCFDDSPCGVLKKANAAYIAAANPEIVIALIERIEELERQVDWLATQLADASLVIEPPCGADCNPCDLACRQEQWREAARKAIRE